MPPMTSFLLRHLLVLCCLLAAPAFAQCTPQWSPIEGVPGVDGPVWATTVWDPDGAGPATAVFVVAGDFEVAGDTVAGNLAIYDPATSLWSTLGAGIDGYVYALATSPSGELFVGGEFTSAGGVAAHRIARWAGGSFSGLGSGVHSTVRAIAVLPNGDVVAGGQSSAVRSRAQAVSPSIASRVGAAAPGPRSAVSWVGPPPS